MNFQKYKNRYWTGVRSFMEENTNYDIIDLLTYGDKIICEIEEEYKKEKLC